MDDVVEFVDAPDGQRVEEESGHEKADRAGGLVVAIEILGAVEQPGALRGRVHAAGMIASDERAGSLLVLYDFQS